MPYRVALIGAGGMGRIHLRCWSAIPDVDVVAIIAEPIESAQSLIKQTGIVGARAYQSFDAALHDCNPDIVDICSPTATHADYVVQAAAAGKALFVEKPLGRTLVDCDRAVAAVEQAGVPAMAGHVVRYFPAYAQAKRSVDAGAVGIPATVRVSRVCRHPGKWYGDHALSGGALLDLSIHDFDWLLWTFGQVDHVYARSVSQPPAGVLPLDYALVTLRFKSGVIGHLTGSWAHSAGFRTTFEIAGDTGLIDHDSARTSTLSVQLQKPTTPNVPATLQKESPLAPADDPYFQELKSFVDSLKNGENPPVTLQEAHNAVRVALAAIESAKSGKVIHI